MMYIAHHGTKGQRWGIRRFQNPDGSLTALGRKRRGVMDKIKSKKSSGKESYKNLSDDELNARTRHYNTVNNYIKAKKQYDENTNTDSAIKKALKKTMEEQINRAASEAGKQLVNKMLHLESSNNKNKDSSNNKNTETNNENNSDSLKEIKSKISEKLGRQIPDIYGVDNVDKDSNSNNNKESNSSKKESNNSNNKSNKDNNKANQNSNYDIWSYLSKSQDKKALKYANELEKSKQKTIREIGQYESLAIAKEVVGPYMEQIKRDYFDAYVKEYNVKKETKKNK